MGRKIRICLSKTTYLIVTRCANRDNLLKYPFVKDMLIAVIDETQNKYDFELNAFEILDNHIHFIIKTKNDIHTISKIMQRIKSVFAKRYNKLMGRCGPFWNGRFGSKIIEHAKNTVSYFIKLIHYLSKNSVRKGYVKDPREYIYGSFNCYLCKDFKSKLKVTIHDYFFMLGETFDDCVNVLLGVKI